jgi:zinc transport system substrate-binding protein
MDQSRVALAAIAIIIPLAMVATVFTGGRPEVGNAERRVQVVTSFYPLYYFASRVAGDRADVTSMVPPGIEPHDWEPSAGDVTRARSADLLVINGAGFEGWANDIGAKKIVNTGEGLGDGNPHIWLDPMLAKNQVESIRSALVQADPANADYYSKNAAEFSAELDSLDSFIRSELGDCEKSDFIAFHDAFGLFAKRYGLVQHSIHGISPEGEVLPQRIQQTVELANELGINIVYAEDLLGGRLAEVIADEIPGGRVLVLSPIEGTSKEEQAAGIGYIEKMRENVASLREGLQCA